MTYLCLGVPGVVGPRHDLFRYFVRLVLVDLALPLRNCCSLPLVGVKLRLVLLLIYSDGGLGEIL